MIHWDICKYYHISVMKTCWEHIAEKVVKNKQVKILQDFWIQTDKALAHNIPNITGWKEEIVGNLKLKDYGINQDKIFICKLQKAKLLGSTPIVCHYFVSFWEELNMNETLKNWQHEFTFFMYIIKAIIIDALGAIPFP